MGNLLRAVAAVLIVGAVGALGYHSVSEALVKTNGQSVVYNNVEHFELVPATPQEIAEAEVWWPRAVAKRFYGRLVHKLESLKK